MTLKAHAGFFYFWILFSITGRTALIQSSWLHTPEERHPNTHQCAHVHTHAHPPPGNRALISLGGMKPPLSWLTEIDGALSKSIQLVQSAVHGDVTHKVEGVLVLGRRLCIEFKHLLSAHTDQHHANRREAQTRQNIRVYGGSGGACAPSSGRPR